MNVLFAAGVAASLAATGLPEAGTEPDAADRAMQASVVEQPRPAADPPHLVPVEHDRIASAPAAPPAATTAQPPRGFFWTVAAIVLAGLILAVIL